MKMSIEQSAGRSVPNDPPWVRAIGALTTWAAAAGGIICLLLAIQVSLDVAMRAFLNEPLAGTLEIVAIWWMPSIAYLALGYAQFRDEQVRVTLVTEGASIRVQRGLALLAEAVAGVTIFWMVWVSIDKAWESVLAGESTALVPWVGIWATRLVIVASLVIWELAVVARLYRLWRGTAGVENVMSALGVE